jgi:hypothetical protein
MPMKKYKRARHKNPGQNHLSIDRVKKLAMLVMYFSHLKLSSKIKVQNHKHTLAKPAIQITGNKLQKTKKSSIACWLAAF